MSDPDNEYYLRSRGRITGPHTLQGLVTLRERRRLGRSDQLSVDPREWFPARQLPELFPQTATRRAREPIDEFADLPEEPMTGSTENTSTDEGDWFYQQPDGNVEIGPVPYSKVERLVREGTLRSKHQVWRDGWPDWRLIEEVPQLANWLSTSAHQDKTLQSGGSSSAATAAMWLGLTPWLVALAGFAIFLLFIAIAKESQAPSLIGLLALGSSLFGVLSNLAWFVTSVLAIVFGGIGMSRTGEGKLAGRGRAITGLTLGIVNLSMPVLLVVLAAGASASHSF